jgi:hypothetical protein
MWFLGHTPCNFFCAIKRMGDGLTYFSSVSIVVLRAACCEKSDIVAERFKVPARALCISESKHLRSFMACTRNAITMASTTQ